MSKAFRILAAAATAAAALTTITPARAATPPKPLCWKDQLYRVASRGEGLVIRNDVFGAGTECLTVKGHSYPAWRVQRNTLPANGIVNAFPNMYYGCEWGHCSQGTVLPERASTADAMHITWQTTSARPAGMWNKTLDFWFMLHRHIYGQAGGAELMVWLDATYAHPSDARVVQIENHRWWLVLRRPCLNGRCWNRISLWPYRTLREVRHMPMLPFLRYAEARHLIQRDWWLTAVEAGDEIYDGGIGLTTISFHVTP